MNMQERIADEIEQAFTDALDVDTSIRLLAEAGAAAVIKAMPGMIKPLVWGDVGRKDFTRIEATFFGTHYQIDTGNDWVSSLWINGIFIKAGKTTVQTGSLAGHCFDGPDAAIAAANAHHAATIMGAFE